MLARLLLPLLADALLVAGAWRLRRLHQRVSVEVAQEQRMIL
jgi:hypothetical protein